MRGVLCSRLRKEDIVIHGAARGADSMAGRIAKEIGCEVLAFPAHWEHKGCPADCKEIEGKIAGNIRNGKMLKEGKPELVLAFHVDIEHSRGTKDMIRRAKWAKVPVELFP